MTPDLLQDGAERSLRLASRKADWAPPNRAAGMRLTAGC
jgi:hypothetical protein